MSGERFDPEVEGAFAQLEHDLPRVAPRAGLLDEIVAALPVADRPAPVAPQRGGWWRRRPPFAIPAGGALVALVAALVIALVVSGGPAPAESAAIVAHGRSGAHGRVEIFDPATTEGRLVVSLKGLGPAPAGEHYTVWVLRSGVAEMTPVASLAEGRDVRLDLPLPSPGRYDALDISLQRDDASPVHSSISVAGAKLS